MFRFLVLMLKLPFEVFTYSMQTLARTAEGFKRIADRTIDTAVSVTDSESVSESSTVVACDDTTPKEESKMSENSLSNDDVKIVQYSIVSIKPDQEELLDGPTIKVITDNMTGQDFASWVIAEYAQSKDPNPKKQIDHKDKKYLRVCYEVICTFAKVDSNYEKDQTEQLTAIASTLREGVKIANWPSEGSPYQPGKQPGGSKAT